MSDWSGACACASADCLRMGCQRQRPAGSNPFNRQNMKDAAERDLRESLERVERRLDAIFREMRRCDHQPTPGVYGPGQGEG